MKDRSLAFYARYASECDLLAEATDDYQVFDLDSVIEELRCFIGKDEDRQLIGSVLKEAEQQAQYLLDQCSERLTKVLSKNGLDVTSINKRSMWEREIRAKPKTESTKNFLHLGFDIFTNEDGHLESSSWIWARGGRQTRDKIYGRITQYHTGCTRSQNDSATILMERVSLAEHQTDGILHRSEIIERLCASFEKISASDYADVWGFIRSASSRGD